MARNVKRSPNFSASEIELLTEEVEKRQQILFSRQNSVVTNSLKKEAWEEIAEKVNAVNESNHLRSGEEIKKKWTCMSSETKKKLALNKREQRKTGGEGGGSLPTSSVISPIDEKIEGIIGETSISGVEGGIDVLDHALTSNLPKPTNALSNKENTDKDGVMHRTKTGVKRQRGQGQDEQDDSTCNLIVVEEERLKVEKDRLKIEEQRLKVEEKRLKVEEELLKIEHEKHRLHLCQLGIIQSVDVSVNNSW